ncbi:hypothetical protein CH330_04730 [candidate division WOR-3 bacterium JGI_Cruoil_03_51_56]|uniref:TNase-like domain-containing protein n=1 Tax=candidate division WOR-3 bacterium JGI_Cruoil_03_51_56 TaxID=1973747 RepID=A0A235BUB6_UNCW3|nr:MAG: hypothetical protein CH330_04730 [candidate division WOR-3 bacterium JGI_Cruoil_03_51_56]
MRDVLIFMLVLCSGLFADEVTRVIKINDGDTFMTSDSEYVRMLGIDAAETYQPGGDIATEMLEKYISGKTVRLVRDGPDKDHFGRLLRYVYVDSLMVNAEMVKKGYATVRLYQKHLKYQDSLEQLEKEACRIGKGLWAFNVFTPPSIELLKEKLAKESLKDSGVISWIDADKHIGELAVVEGTIVTTYLSDKVLHLNFNEDYHRYFNVAVFTTELYKFPAHPDEYYRNKKVRVTGIIKGYKGAPNMVVKDPGQIEVLKQEQ